MKKTKQRPLYFFKHRLGLIFCFVYLVLSSPVSASQEMRIITLSPHLTELVFELGLGDALVAVSDYSDYPEQAKSLPKVASYQGANIAEIMRLKPTHILVWKGGNKDSDILQLSQYSKSANAKLHISDINSIESLLDDLSALGAFFDVSTTSDALVAQLKNLIDNENNKNTPKFDVFYYMGIAPLYGLGSDPWLNSLLRTCDVNNKNQSAAAAYMPLDKKHILRDPPDVLIAADNLTREQHEAFWSPHRAFIDAPIIIVNPDALHRFTPRAIYETIELCEQLRMIPK